MGHAISIASMPFLDEHLFVDPAHNRLLQGYLRRLVRTDADLAAVAYLYGEMFADAINAADYGACAKHFSPNEAGRTLQRGLGRIQALGATVS